MVTIDKRLQEFASGSEEEAIVSSESNEILVPIALHTLSPTAILAYDLYLWANDKSDPVLYRERSLSFTQDDIDRLMKTGIRTLFLPIDDHTHYRQQLQEMVATTGDVAPHERYRTLRELNRCVFESGAARSQSESLGLRRRRASLSAVSHCLRQGTRSR